MKLSRKQIAIAIILISMMTFYAGSYYYLRRNGAIIHSYTWSNVDNHSVRATMPEGPSIFAAALSSKESLDELLARELRKARIIDNVYYPLRKLEEAYWSIWYK